MLLRALMSIGIHPGEAWEMELYECGVMFGNDEDHTPRVPGVNVPLQTWEELNPGVPNPFEAEQQIVLY